jgi:hypothetical protein
VAHLLHDIIPLISTNRKKFYLKPPDFSISNVFVDDFNITCLTDWTSCSTVPLSHLLITPAFSHPRDAVDEQMTQIFKDAVNSSSLQLDPLLWDLAQKSRLFMQLIELDGVQDYTRFLELSHLYLQILTRPKCDNISTPSDPPQAQRVH